MSARAGNIALLLILLNGSAIVVGATVGADVGFNPAPGASAAISDLQSELTRIEATTQGLDSFIGATVAAANLFGAIFGLLIAAPRMFTNLGMPPILTAVVTIPLYLIAGLDIAAAITGGDVT